MTNDVRSSFPARLRALIGAEPVAAFARKCGMGESAMRSYLNGADPSRQNVEKIWRGSGCSLYWLMTGEGDMYDDDKWSEPSRVKADAGVITDEEGREFVKIPQYDVTVSAGSGAQSESEHVAGHIAFEREWFEREIGIPPRSAAVVEVRGKSMEPDLYDGDLAVVDLRNTRFVDDAIYVVRQGPVLRLKKVRMRLDGKIEIRSSNEGAYPPEVVTAEEAEGIVIVGRAGTAVPKVRRLS